MKNAPHFVMTTDENGNDSPLLVSEIYGSVLPNVIQNALIEAFASVQELYDVITPAINTKAELAELMEMYISVIPVLQADAPGKFEDTMLATLKFVHEHRIALLRRLNTPSSDKQQRDVIAA